MFCCLLLRCHHGEQGKCLNCVPLEPYDMSYLSSLTPPIKFVSFHAYIKSRKSGVDRGKYLNLQSVNCKIKPGCIDHLPWPKGICNKCQPSSIYLNRQVGFQKNRAKKNTKHFLRNLI